jgi:23S rRNA (adenine2503-C2)-methyltransferase
VLPDVRQETRETLTARFKEWDVPHYRVDQLLHWLWPRRAASWDEMTNLPKALRESLAGTFSLGSLTLARKQGSRDTTQKFLWQLHDGAYVESVLIPANPALYGDRADRHTLCVSSTSSRYEPGATACSLKLPSWRGIAVYMPPLRTTRTLSSGSSVGAKTIAIRSNLREAIYVGCIS